MNTRRQFLITAPLGVLGAAAACGGEQPGRAVATPPPTPGAPPTFGTAPSSGPPVSASTFAEAEKLAQVTMSAAEREMAATPIGTVESLVRCIETLTQRRVIAGHDDILHGLLSSVTLAHKPGGQPIGALERASAQMGKAIGRILRLGRRARRVPAE